MNTKSRDLQVRPLAVIPSAAEGSRRETFEVTSSGSLDCARDDGL